MIVIMISKTSIIIYSWFCNNDVCNIIRKNEVVNLESSARPIFTFSLWNWNNGGS